MSRIWREERFKARDVPDLQRPRSDGRRPGVLPCSADVPGVWRSGADHHRSVHRLSWRGDGATRLVVLVADAPPHLDYGTPTYDEDMQAALALHQVDS